MKRRWNYLLIPIFALGVGLLLIPKAKPPAPVIAEPAPVVEQSTPPVIAVKPPEPVIQKEPEPEPIKVAEVKVPPPAPPQKKTAPTPLSLEERQRLAINRYYDHMERNFSRQLTQLDQERDPARRDKLIQSLARNARADTLATLDWAMSLEDPAEQRAALDAFNKNSLTGIGARIVMDESGIPKIKDTTILSAVDSTGMVQPGDLISGMVNADGSTISFKGMNMQQIVNHLRGQPGSQIQLRMARSPEYGSTQPIPFDVPVQRSLIVMQRPF